MTAFPSPCLALVTDRRRCRGPLEAAVAEAVAGGVDLVQLREGDLAPGPLLRLARRLAELTRGRALFVVNGPPELARACAADGVHLPERGGSVAGARLSLGPGRLVGQSVHSAARAAPAEAAGADYLCAGTVYATPSKPGLRPAGPGLLTRVRRATALPVLAIGGVTAGRAPAALAAGASGVAVCSAILGADEPGRAAAALKAALQAGRTGGSTVSITVNGKPMDVAAGSSVASLLELLGLSSRPVAVALAGEILSPSVRGRRRLRPGDILDLVHAVPGG